MRTLMALLAVGLSLIAGNPAQAEIKDLLDPYLRIHASLAHDKTDSIKADAAAIGTAAGALGDNGVKLREAATALEGAVDLKGARTAFGDLTDALLAYAEQTKSALPAEVRVAYCPMVQKSWLQKDEAIANPYYGSSMLTCGTFKKK